MGRTSGLGSNIHPNNTLASRSSDPSLYFGKLITPLTTFSHVWTSFPSMHATALAPNIAVSGALLGEGEEDDS